ncbi:MAG: two-component sensor histidine kinase, partial [Nocardioides sp.]
MSSVQAPGAVRRALTFWRRSIQARVVASTVLLSLLVVGGVGWFLLTQTRDGLLDKRVSAVVLQATAETEVARQALATAPGTDVDVAGQRVALIEPLKERGSAGGFQVVLAGPIRSSSTLISDGVVLNSAGLDIASVPVRLQRHFAEAATTRNDTTT